MNSFDSQALREQAKEILRYIQTDPTQTLIPPGRVDLLDRTLHLKSPKPPIGLTSRTIHDESRLEDVRSAILRYVEAGQIISPEWVDEYNKLLTP